MSIKSLLSKHLLVNIDFRRWREAHIAATDNRRELVGKDKSKQRYTSGFNKRDLEEEANRLLVRRHRTEVAHV